MPIRRRSRKVSPRPLFEGGDAWLLLEIPFLMMVATLVPEHRWARVCENLERLKFRLGLANVAKVEKGLAAMQIIPPTRENAVRILGTRTEHHVQIFRDFLWGWNAPIDVEGVHYLETARAANKGAILWVGHFAFNSLATKKGIRSSGFMVSHLSRPEHGFSKSLYGISVLNPIRVRTETRYLQERVAIDTTNPYPAIVRARQLLRDNGIVSVTAGAWEGAVIASVKVGGCVQDLATGAPRLALITGSPIHPVFCVRDNTTGRVRVVIGSALSVPQGGKDDNLLSYAQEFADRLLPFVVDYPDQWRDWDKVQRLPR
jgi:hypothetical protein